MDWGQVLTIIFGIGGFMSIFMFLVNKRIDTIEKRFDDINKRFEDMNKRFDDINKRFEDINRRLDKIDDDIREIRQLLYKVLEAEIKKE